MVRLGPISSSDGRKPGTPIIGTATAGNTQATVAFTAPSYLGKPDSPLTYTAISSPSSIQNTGSGSPITVTGLSNGTSYSFTVKLSNTVLDSDFSSSSNNITPAGATPPPPPPPPPPPSFPPPPPSFPPPPTFGETWGACSNTGFYGYSQCTAPFQRTDYLCVTGTQTSNLGNTRSCQSCSVFQTAIDGACSGF